MTLTFTITDNEITINEHRYKTTLYAPHQRTVQIKLTDEQIEKLNLRETGLPNGTKNYEFISHIFVERGAAYRDQREKTIPKED